MDKRDCYVWLPDHRFIYQYCWEDGADIFDYHTDSLRHLYSPSRPTPHRRLIQWQSLFNLHLDEKRLWHETWDPSRRSAENCFLWQIIYTPTTQHWRFPDLPPADPATWCTRCDLNLQEDIMHCMWFCPLSRQVWLWAQEVLHLAACKSAPSPVLKPEHDFVAHPLPQELLIPDCLWSITRPIIVWNIWKNR